MPCAACRSTSAVSRRACVRWRARCARIDTMKIIDFHTHFFSSTFFETLAAQSPIPGDSHKKLADASRKAGFELPSRDLGEHTARWLAELEKHRVDHMASFASVPEEIPAVCEAAALSKGR